MALPATDTFTAADGTALTTYSANWTYNFNTFSINTNAVHCSSGGGAEAGARWNADTFPNDQYAQGVLVANAGSTGAGPAVRVQSGTSGDYYGYYADSGGRSMFTMIGATWTQKGAASSVPAVNDVLRLEAVGSTMTAKLNGAVDTAVGTSGVFTDSTFTAGAAGITGWGALTTTRLDTWEGGSLAAGGTTMAPAEGALLLAGVAPVANVPTPAAIHIRPVGFV